VMKWGRALSSPPLISYIAKSKKGDIMLGMTENKIKDVIDQECFGIPGLFMNIRDQSLLDPQDILRKMASAVAKAISANNEAIERDLARRGISK